MHGTEGYVKFSIEMNEADPPQEGAIAPINEARTRLWRTGLIGIYPDGIGFGNVSVRAPATSVAGFSGVGPSSFYVSGTATGAAEQLASRDFALVYGYDRNRNMVRCSGVVRASSESLSHGACYEANEKIAAVIHVHSRELFDFMQENSFPATSVNAENGTPEIAAEIFDLVTDVGEDSGIFFMGGHDEGVIAYGPDIASAEEILMEVYRKAASKS